MAPEADRERAYPLPRRARHSSVNDRRQLDLSVPRQAQDDAKTGELPRTARHLVLSNGRAFLAVDARERRDDLRWNFIKRMADKAWHAPSQRLGLTRLFVDCASRAARVCGRDVEGRENGAASLRLGCQGRCRGGLSPVREGPAVLGFGRRQLGERRRIAQPCRGERPPRNCSWWLTADAFTCSYRTVTPWRASSRCAPSRRRASCACVLLDV